MVLFCPLILQNGTDIHFSRTRVKIHRRPRKDVIAEIHQLRVGKIRGKTAGGRIEIADVIPYVVIPVLRRKDKQIFSALRAVFIGQRNDVGHFPDRSVFRLVISRREQIAHIRPVGESVRRRSEHMRRTSAVDLTADHHITVVADPERLRVAEFPLRPHRVRLEHRIIADRPFREIRVGIVLRISEPHVLRRAVGAGVVARRDQQHRPVLLVEHDIARPDSVRRNRAFRRNHRFFHLFPLHHVIADPVPPTDIPPIGTDRIILIEQMPFSVIAEQRMRLVHPVRGRRGMILRTIPIAFQHAVRQPCVIVIDRGHILSALRHLRRISRNRHDGQFVHQTVEFTHLEPRLINGLGSGADKDFLSRRLNGRPLSHRRFPREAAVDVQGHFARVSVKDRRQTAPFISGKLILCVVGKTHDIPVVSRSHPESGVAEFRNPQQKTFLCPRIVRTDNHMRRMLFGRILRGAPRIGARAYIDIDRQGVSAYVPRIGKVLRIPVKAERGALNPLRPIGQDGIVLKTRIVENSVHDGNRPAAVFVDFRKVGAFKIQRQNIVRIRLRSSASARVFPVNPVIGRRFPVGITAFIKLHGIVSLSDLRSGCIPGDDVVEKRHAPGRAPFVVQFDVQPLADIARQIRDKRRHCRQPAPLVEIRKTDVRKRGVFIIPDLRAVLFIHLYAGGPPAHPETDLPATAEHEHGRAERIAVLFPFAAFGRPTVKVIVSLLIIRQLFRPPYAVGNHRFRAENLPVSLPFRISPARQITRLETAVDDRVFLRLRRNFRTTRDGIRTARDGIRAARDGIRTARDGIRTARDGIRSSARHAVRAPARTAARVPAAGRTDGKRKTQGTQCNQNRYFFHPVSSHSWIISGRERETPLSPASRIRVFRIL